MKPEAKCNRCKFWKRVKSGDGAEVGECRRNAPHLTGPFIFEIGQWYAWPFVSATDWCGEFKVNIEGSAANGD